MEELPSPKEAPLEPCPWQTTFEELRRSATALEAELVACRPHVELPPWPAEGDEELWRQLSALRRQVKSLRAGEKTEALEERLAAFKERQGLCYDELFEASEALEKALQRLNGCFERWELAARPRSAERSERSRTVKVAGEDAEILELKAELAQLDAEATGGTGGWPMKSHEVFLRILRIFRMQVTPQCYARLSQQFPDVSQVDLAEHLRFCHDQEARQARRRLLLARWRQRKLLLEKTAQESKEAPEEERVPDKEAREAVRQKVKQWRIAKAKEETLQSAEEKMRREAEQGELEMKRKRREKQLKSFADAYKRQRAEEKRQADLAELRSVRAVQPLSEQDKRRIVQRNLEMLTRKLQAVQKRPQSLPVKSRAYDHVESRLYDPTECFVQKAFKGAAES